MEDVLRQDIIKAIGRVSLELAALSQAVENLRGLITQASLGTVRYKRIALACLRPIHTLLDSKAQLLDELRWAVTGD